MYCFFYGIIIIGESMRSKKLDKITIFGIACLVFSISGFVGWIYEFIFYYLNSGMKTFYYRGANFFPWINIYATGSLLIFLLTRKLKNKPLLVFLISVISTGILEFLSGYFILEITGNRYWDYNTEIWNFGNIGGFVCLRSVLCFGLSGLLLMYLVIPMCIKIAEKSDKKTFLIITITLASLILFDELYNLVFARILGFPRANAIYKKIGFKYM